MAGQSFMEGNEAVAWGAMAAGCRFFAGDPITPANSILSKMLELLPPSSGICLQGEDEIFPADPDVAIRALRNHGLVIGKPPINQLRGEHHAALDQSDMVLADGQLHLVIRITEHPG